MNFLPTKKYFVIYNYLLQKVHCKYISFSNQTMGLTEQWALSFVVHIVSTWFSTEVVFANNYIMTERENC